MSDICGAKHPEVEVACTIRGEVSDHDEHFGIGPDGPTDWPNEDYQPKIRASLPKTAKARLVEIAANAGEKKAPPMTQGEFGGETYVAEFDRARLGKQLGVVYDLMADGGWRTLSEIGHEVDAPEASVSARLRDLRKPEFGALSVERRRRGAASAGVHEYRLTPQEEISA